MTWDLLWRNWYCLGRQQYPVLALAPDRFRDYLDKHRDAVEKISDPDQQAAAQAYLVAAALERDDPACAALLAFPAQDGLPLQTCLERIARKRCPDGYQQVVADFIGSWYYGTPKRAEPFIARWTPTGDFTRFCLVSIKRLAQAEQDRRRNLVQIPEGFEPGAPEAGRSHAASSGAASGPVARQIRDFVECFVSKLSDRCCRVVAVASQLQINQKMLARKLGVSEPTVTRDVQQVVQTQTECIRTMHLETEPEQAWWWSDVRAVAAEHPRIIRAAADLLETTDRGPSEENGDAAPENL